MVFGWELPCCTKKNNLVPPLESCDFNMYLFIGGSEGRRKTTKKQQGDREADPKGQASLSCHPPSPPPRPGRVWQIYPG